MFAGVYRQDDDYEPTKAGSIDGTDTIPHDHAIVRAEIAKATRKYDADRDPKIQGNPERTLFVGRLSHSTTESTIQHTFSRYGRLARYRLVRDIVTGASKGYAFVEFEREGDARMAWGDRVELDGRILLLEFERERMMRNWIPRRLGGGLGGKKESGQLRFGGRDRPFKKPISIEPGGAGISNTGASSSRGGFGRPSFGGGGGGGGGYSFQQHGGNFHGRDSGGGQSRDRDSSSYYHERQGHRGDGGDGGDGGHHGRDRDNHRFAPYYDPHQR